MRIRSGTILRINQFLLVLIGLSSLAGFAWLKYEENVGQAALDERFERALAEQQSSMPVPAPPPGTERDRGQTTTDSPPSVEKESPQPRDGPGSDTRIVGRLKCERIGLEVIVAEGTDAATLRRAAGMVPTGVRPGEQGNLTIAAHRDTYFRSLRNIRRGDEIALETPQGTAFVFRVEWIAVVEPTDVTVMEATSDSALTLVTCFPFDYIGPAPRRFIVRATEVERVSLGSNLDHTTS